MSRSVIVATFDIAPYLSKTHPLPDLYSDRDRKKFTPDFKPAPGQNDRQQGGRAGETAGRLEEEVTEGSG
jgi:hypothetical protein